MKERDLKKSNKLWEQGKSLFLGGSQLYSKAPYAHIEGVYPAYIEKGKNAHVWDVDGNEYIDWEMALGPIVLGWGYERVDQAVMDQLKKGMTFSQMSPIEIEYGELLRKHVPSAYKMRFLKTGSGATEAAIRIARAYTNRKIIIRGEYHGWHDWTASGEKARQGGILPEIRPFIKKFEYNELDKVERYFKEFPDQIAAVITEPVILEPPKDNFLNRLKTLCHENGALLIFDEVVSGFRFAIGGAQTTFHVTPDLTTFGKGMANGMPLSAVVGIQEIMDRVDSNVFISTTFGGEALSLAAAIALIKEMEEQPVHRKIWDLGNHMIRGFNERAQRVRLGMRAKGYAPRVSFEFEDAIILKQAWLYKSIFMQECAKRGVLLGWCLFPCYTHTQEDADFTLQVFEEAMVVVKRAVESDHPEQFLEGKSTTAILG